MMNNVEITLWLLRAGADQSIVTDASAGRGSEREIMTGATPMCAALKNASFDCFWACVSEGGDVEGSLSVTKSESLNIFGAIALSKVRLLMPMAGSRHGITRGEGLKKARECWDWAMRNCKVRPNRDTEGAFMESTEGLPDTP
jgi:hypothetical protein